MAKLPLRENSASNTYSVTRDTQKAKEGSQVAAKRGNIL